MKLIGKYGKESKLIRVGLAGFALILFSCHAKPEITIRKQDIVQPEIPGFLPRPGSAEIVNGEPYYLIIAKVKRTVTAADLESRGVIVGSMIPSGTVYIVTCRVKKKNFTDFIKDENVIGYEFGRNTELEMLTPDVTPVNPPND